MNTLTPKQIVSELDKYIVGQDEAKKAVAVALRNRYRRMQLPEDIREEVTPKNILMVGPTGVGKTEIARRLAKLVDAPFVKVEATKFTEVGYVGRDVDSIIRDLTEAGIRLIKEQQTKNVHDLAVQAANNRIVELISHPVKKKTNPIDIILGNRPKEPELSGEEKEKLTSRREDIRRQLEAGELEDSMVEVEVEEFTPRSEIPGTDMSINDMMGGMLPKKTKLRRVTVSEARRILTAQEEDTLIDMDKVYSDAISRVEQHGIVFIDEIDKVASRGASGGRGPDVSREGVQRDILPIVEGCTVNTKYGPVRTDHILFIAAGAFHVSKVTDLIPELQGRFPVRVDLKPLTAEDYKRILTQPKNALITQYRALLGVDGVDIEFDDEALTLIAKHTYDANENGENIGARRLHTVLEQILSDIAFNAGGGDAPVITVTVNAEYVNRQLSGSVKEADLNKFIL
ncbi:MAG: ATP-dependent protease ATPase subunit HslU [Clostridia bacterium]|nr:ATP-dependent protease ATPase subunit HslU [Clostridia bacterium]